MRKHLSARGCLFLFVRTHHHLEYYLNLGDVRCAANQNGISPSFGFPQGANVIEIHPVARVQAQHHQ
ncbi:MAG: hypothetical protein M3N91_02740 [Pseudomonadota bacterium]|nr:hypothetical protein [Pseudomonadota bacterium]